MGKYTERAKRLGRVLFTVGALGLPAIGGSEYLDRTGSYKVHVEAESLKERQEYEYFRKAIAQQFGEEIAERIESADKAAYFKRLRGEAPSLPKPKGFEKIGLKDEKLEELWSPRFYPDSWLRNIKEIYFCGDREEIGERYGKELANEKKDGEFERGVIKFFLEKDVVIDPEKIYDLDKAFGHEIGHGNDWETNARLSRRERVELLFQSMSQMSSDKSFKWANEEYSGQSYHGKIQNDDHNLEAYLQTKEYFATLCEAYFSQPGRMSSLYPEDFKTISELVQRTDPNFDPIKAGKDKNDLRHQMVK